MSHLDLEQSLQRVHEWIKAADQKASIFLGFQGVIISLLFSDIFYWLKGNMSQFSFYDVLFLISGIVLVGYSLYKSVSAIIPRLKNHNGKKSLTYFGDIARLELEDFRKKIKSVSGADYENELIDQIHISSKIAVRKHYQFRDSVITFFAGMVLLAFIYLLFKFA
jgi:hypothetical protein